MSKSTNLHIEQESGFLNARLSGRYPVEHKEATIKAIAAAIKAHPVKAALVDMREIAGPLSFMDRYQVGELAGRYLTKVPIAVLAHAAQLDQQQIGKLVATNRGAKLEIFTDPTKARAWLNKFCAPDK